MKVSKTFYQDMEDLPASHPLYGSEQSKSGFGICYQFAIKCPVSVSKTQCFQGFAGFVSYSHSAKPHSVQLRYLLSGQDGVFIRHGWERYAGRLYDRAAMIFSMAA